MTIEEKQEQQGNGEEKTDFGLVKPSKIEEEMKEAYLDYAMSVIISRALPDVRDGLKPVHRRILYAMSEMGLNSKAKYRKSAAVTGQTMAKYHPHGDIPVYDSLVRMAQDFAMRYPLVDGQGNFGSIDGDPPAAQRYTECRMTPISEELLSDIEKETVNFMDNYDGTTKEPVVLPASLPNLLLNGTMGIAVGMATNIPPHNLSEVLDATIHLIDNPEASIDDLLKFIKGPDFPTGGVIYDFKEIKEAYATGKGKILIRGVAKIETKDEGKGARIIISEIPYGVNKADLVSKIADLSKLRKIEGLSDLRDESDREGIRIVLDLKKGAFPQKILNQLFKFTQLQETFHLNMLALVDGLLPRVLTLKMVLENWLKHRREVVQRRCQFDLKRAKERAHILEGLKKAQEKIGKVIETIKRSESREKAKENLMKKFALDEIQAEAILEMRLAALARLEREKIEEELKEKKKMIVYLEDVLAHPAKILQIIKKELFELKEKYQDERRTKLVKSPLSTLTDEDLVPNEEVIITLTRGNYIKRTPVFAFRSQARGGKGKMGMETKEEDVVSHLISTFNLDNILFFTNKGRVFQTKVYEIPQASRTAKGTALVNIIPLGEGEQVTSISRMRNDERGYIFMATKNGIVKKTLLEDFGKVRKTGLIALRLDLDDELRWAKLTKGNDEILLVSKNGLSIRFSEQGVRPMGRGSRGIRGMRLKKGDEVIGMDVVKKENDLLIVTENGLGKRTPLLNYRKQNRGGSGIITQRVNEKTGKVVGAEILGKEILDVILVSKLGQVIRIPLKKIPRQGRATQGVRLMRLNEGDKIASLSYVQRERVEEAKTKGLEKEKVKIHIYKKLLKKPMPKVKIHTYKEPLSKPLFTKRPLKKREPKKTTEILKEAGLKSESPKGEPNYWGKDRTLWKRR